ncbi:MAG: UDP-3-O-acyl-N-acetylglucosamine deacetylase, partial [Verrucomicrobia bacterium]|nr:UDP-3-O-acyl-N-acetylglucosamine deacetylase [Verrucomicrobiota bacterium]
MRQQQTIREPVSASGIGLHTGQKVTMTFRPAPAGAGIRFRRTDLESRPEIEAAADNVADTTRCTTLGKGKARIRTVEHVLAAFHGMGVT